MALISEFHNDNNKFWFPQDTLPNRLWELNNVYWKISQWTKPLLLVKKKKIPESKTKQRINASVWWKTHIQKQKPPTNYRATFLGLRINTESLQAVPVIDGALGSCWFVFKRREGWGHRVGRSLHHWTVAPRNNIDWQKMGHALWMSPSHCSSLRRWGGVREQIWKAQLKKTKLFKPSLKQNSFDETDLLPFSVQFVSMKSGRLFI